MGVICPAVMKVRADLSDPTLPSTTPDFLNHDRAPVPDIVVARGLLPFRLRDRPVRGRLVRLGPLAHALLTRHENSAGVTALLGQALAMTAGLAAALKFRGSFSLQAKGDGPVTMLLADCTDTGALRGYARADADRVAGLEGAGAMLGKGYLAFTCDQGPDMDRYQGIVPIEGDTLAAMSDTYFRTSEQLRTHVHLAAAETPAGWRAAAFIMERVAADGGIDAPEDAEEAWRTALALAGTLSDAELLDDALPPERLLHRLFHAEGLVVDQARALSYGCRCSRAKLAGVLEGFAPEDLDHMAEQGTITMTCEFCNVGFKFERDEMRRADP